MAYISELIQYETIVSNFLQFWPLSFRHVIKYGHVVSGSLSDLLYIIFILTIQNINHMVIKNIILLSKEGFFNFILLFKKINDAREFI